MSDKNRRPRALLSGAGFLLAAVTALALPAALSACGGGSHEAKRSILPTNTGGQNVTQTAESQALEDALLLEYVKAETYLRATTGAGLEPADRGQGAGDVTGDSRVTFTQGGDVEGLAQELAADAVEHVRTLRTLLGDQAPPRPDMDLTQRIAALAAASGYGSGFDPFADEESFLVAMSLLQDEAVRIYQKDIPQILDRGRLAAVLAILSEDAAHAGAARGLLAANGTPAPGGFAPQ